MKRRTFSFKYMLMTSRLDMLWLPFAFLALFWIVAWMTRDTPTGFAVCAAYLGAALPMIGGILAAYAILDDPALELQFATARPVWMMLLERLGIIMLLTALCAFIYQAAVAALQIDMASLGSLPARQLAWLPPTLAMVALGSAVAFLGRQSVTGAAVVGMVWIIQIIIRDWFLQNQVGQYFLLIMGSNYPTHPALRMNQAALGLLGLLLLAAAWVLLRRQERYI